jgi:transposase-like protein
MKEYDTAIKDKVISDFLSGTGIMELSRKHEIPKSTLQGWIKKAEHHHHWLVESPNGPKSKGRCVICKEEKYFSNSIEVTSWPKSKPESPNQNGVKQRK